MKGIIMLFKEHIFESFLFIIKFNRLNDFRIYFNQENSS